MREQPIHSRLAGTAPPAPPEHLRAAVLAAAERSWDARPDLWTRLWESAPVRLTWAATVVALAVGNLLLSHPQRRSEAADGRTTGGGPETLARPADPELDEATGKLRLRITRLTWVGEGTSRDASAPARRASRPTKEPS